MRVLSHFVCKNVAVYACNELKYTKIGWRDIGKGVTVHSFIKVVKNVRQNACPFAFCVQKCCCLRLQ